jgi:hypothetical protein
MVVLRNGKAVGELKADIRYLPVSKPEKKEDGTIIPPPESGKLILFSTHTHTDCVDLVNRQRHFAFLCA